MVMIMLIDNTPDTSKRLTRVIKQRESSIHNKNEHIQPTYIYPNSINLPPNPSLNTFSPKYTQYERTAYTKKKAFGITPLLQIPTTLPFPSPFSPQPRYFSSPDVTHQKRRASNDFGCVTCFVAKF